MYSVEIQLEYFLNAETCSYLAREKYFQIDLTC